MAFATLHDLPNNGFLGVSVAPAAQTATVNGAGVDCTVVDGPINAISQVGAAAGSPTSYTVTAKLQESDTSGGTYTDLATQSSPGAQTAAGAVAIRGIRTKKFVRVVQTIAFVSGTSPTIATSAIVIGQNRTFGLQPGASGY
jgi:hypothetical protein